MPAVETRCIAPLPSNCYETTLKTPCRDTILRVSGEKYVISAQTRSSSEDPSINSDYLILVKIAAIPEAHLRRWRKNYSRRRKVLRLYIRRYCQYPHSCLVLYIFPFHTPKNKFVFIKIPLNLHEH